MDSAEGLKTGYFNNEAQKTAERAPHPSAVTEAMTAILGKFAVDRKTGRPLNFESAVSALIGWAMNKKNDKELSGDELLFNRSYSKELSILQRFFSRFTDVTYDYADVLAVLADKAQADKDQKFEKSKELLVDIAIFNQKLANSLYAVSSPDASPADRMNAIIFVETAHALSAKDNQFGRELTKRLSAARSQAATMRLLKQYGYDIIVPDPDDPDEVKMWDVLGKTDFIAISPPPQNAPLLIDMKAYTFANQLSQDSNDPGALVGVSELDILPPHERILRSVEETLTVNGDKMSHLEIRVPADDSNIDLLGTFTNPVVAKEIMRKLHTIVPPHADTTER